MRRKLASIAVTTIAIVFSLQRVAQADPEAQLLAAIMDDPSFKVRMQAIRVLTKRLTNQKRPASDRAIEALGSAATGDDNYLVRGLACFSLGQLGDRRVTPILEKARGDEHPFVREQAEQGLLQVPTAGPEPGVAMKALPLPGRSDTTQATTRPPPSPKDPRSRRSIVLSVEQSGDSAIPKDTVDQLRTGLESRLKSQAGPGFDVGKKADRGFHLAGSVADRRVEVNSGKARISLVVRVTISTWPENHLRHVVTARAMAETASTNDTGRSRLEQRVLEAAVRQAVDEALAEISRE